ncbi:MAG: hypothetical protein V4722_03845 [Bacteroidota bacterium]
MKNTQRLLYSLPLIATFLLFGCKKEIGEQVSPNVENEQAASNIAENAQGCRTTSYLYSDAANDYSQADYYSYQNGLADEWTASYGYRYKLEYDAKGKMKYARAYAGDDLISTIEFVRQKNNIVKEIWYTGNTTTVEDEVTHVYNIKNQLIHSSSAAYDYAVTNAYNNDGDLKSWHYFVGGLPAQKAEYTYKDKFKNPLTGCPGIEYNFPYANAAFGTGKHWYSSEKITLYDELGNESVLYAQNPTLTTAQLGGQNYPELVTYTDDSNGGVITNAFTYENCPGGINDHVSGGTASVPKTHRDAGGKNISTKSYRPLMHGLSTRDIQKLMEARKAYKAR